MITEIQGDTNAFRAMAYGRPDQLTMEWCRQREQQHLMMLDPALQEMYRNLQGTVYGSLDYQSIGSMANALRNNEESIWQTNNIIPLTTMAQFQNPPPIMIDWIMASPDIRTMYHNQQIAGYDDYYVDHHPQDVGENHYHYRRVMNGRFVEHEDGSMVATEWLDDLNVTTDNLCHVDQITITNVWDGILAAINEGNEDPTSRFNANL